MPDVLALKDGRVETLFEVKHFAELIDQYMGYDALRYFRELLDECDEEIKEWKNAKEQTDDFVLRTMLPKIAYGEQLEAWAEEYRAKMEDIYGLEE